MDKRNTNRWDEEGYHLPIPVTREENCTAEQIAMNVADTLIAVRNGDDEKAQWHAQLTLDAVNLGSEWDVFAELTHNGQRCTDKRVSHETKDMLAKMFTRLSAFYGSDTLTYGPEEWHDDKCMRMKVRCDGKDIGHIYTSGAEYRYTVSLFSGDGTANAHCGKADTMGEAKAAIEHIVLA